MRAKALKKNVHQLDIPIDITDIIGVCNEFNKLGGELQRQIQYLFDLGVEEAVKSGKVKVNALPFIKSFLMRIGDNFYFGDASEQACDLVFLIDLYMLNIQYSSLN